MTRIYTLLLLILATGYAAAQPPLGFGIKAGPNISSISLDESPIEYDARFGFHAGLFLRGRFQSFAVQPELLLFTQGGDIDHSILGTAKEKFTYISVPIMFKFYPVGDFNVQIGPQFGFLIDGEREYDTFIGTGSVDITDQYKKSDIAASVGIGYDFPFGLNLDARYNFGLKDINDSDDADAARSRVFLFSIGWNFLR